MTGAQLIRWHPPVWRRRYADEVSALLADRELSTSDQLDLLRSCANAWSWPAVVSGTVSITSKAAKA